MTEHAIRTSLASHANPERAKKHERFHKTGKGEYAEHDVFLGVRVPDIRAIARIHRDASPKTIDALITDPVHEIRLCAIIIMTLQFPRANAEQREELHRFCLERLPHINGWDLVDTGAYKISGEFWAGETDAAVLTAMEPLLANNLMWARRWATVATLALIKRQRFEPTCRAAKVVLNESEDLMHKAAGWMLREMGLRDVARLRSFLETHAPEMPRTMLRYAIEKLDSDERAMWRSQR